MGDRGQGDVVESGTEEGEGESKKEREKEDVPTSGVSPVSLHDSDREGTPPRSSVWTGTGPCEGRPFRLARSGTQSVRRSGVRRPGTGGE